MDWVLFSPEAIPSQSAFDPWRRPLGRRVAEAGSGEHRRSDAWSNIVQASNRLSPTLQP